MEELIQAMLAKGYNKRSDAEATIASRGYADLAREYLGGSGSSGYDGFISPEEYANKIIEAQQKQIKEETSFLEQYTKDNPFIFDEELARQSATAEYEPYYSELLKDYTSDIELKKQSVADETQLITKLRSFDQQANSMAYRQAVANAQEGYAGSGMFFSGNRARGVGELTAGYSLGEQRAGEAYGAQQRGLERQNLALETDLGRKTRDIGREQEAAVESGILQRQSEAQKQYYLPLEQSYYRRFPAGTGAALKGYTLPEYYS